MDGVGCCISLIILGRFLRSRLELGLYTKGCVKYSIYIIRLIITPKFNFSYVVYKFRLALELDLFEMVFYDGRT